MKILLDTCAFLWLTTDAPELSVNAKMAFQNTGNPVYLSSARAIPIFRNATETNSLSTWTLMTPPSAKTASARSALKAFSDNKYNKTFVSKNGLPVFMSFQAIKLEIGRQPPPIFA